jgi:SHS2 domain-containing protein
LLQSGMDKPFSVCRFATTADLGIHVRADSTANLLRGAAWGMFSTMMDLSTVPACETSNITIPIDNTEELPITFLNHLLYLFGAKGLVPLSFPLLEVTVGEVIGEVEWGKVSPRTKYWGNEVKAVTYNLYRWEHMPDKRQRLRIVFDV